jgi:TetR/AcrR family transcriptional repressor of nem operon
VVKVTREQAAASRERILDAAAKLFRERGLDGVGVADIMKSAGLTHGGFYGHFASKDDLMAEACRRALDASIGKWERLAGEGGCDALSTIANSYLSTRHRDNPASGCTVAALAGEVPRQCKDVRRALAAGIEAQIEILARVTPGRTRKDKRSKALASYAAMVGAMVLARAVEDPRLSREILDAATAGMAPRRARGE